MEAHKLPYHHKATVHEGKFGIGYTYPEMSSAMALFSSHDLLKRKQVSLSSTVSVKNQLQYKNIDLF